MAALSAAAPPDALPAAHGGGSDDHKANVWAAVGRPAVPAPPSTVQHQGVKLEHKPWAAPGVLPPVDLIRLYVPLNDARMSVYLRPIPPTATFNDVLALVQYAGPVFAYTCAADYARLRFYTHRAAATVVADAQAGKLRLHGVRIRASLLSRVNMQRASRGALPVSKCVDLLNHYLGFDGWRTRIVEVGVTDRIPPSGLAGLADLSAIIRAHVVVEFPGQAESHGVGYGYRKRPAQPQPAHGETKPAAPAPALAPTQQTTLAQPHTVLERERLRKMAVQAAFQDAFARIVLVVAPSGGVVVCVDSRGPDLPGAAPHAVGQYNGTSA